MTMTSTITNILCPVDFSPSAANAVRSAFDIAEKFGAQVHLLHVVEDPNYYSTRYSWAVPDDIVPQLVRHAKMELALVVPAADRPSIDKPPIRTVKIGNPVSTIIDYVQQNGIDLIVMGTHGRRNVAHLLLGSVAEKIVRLATCPVMTVHLNVPRT